MTKKEGVIQKVLKRYFKRSFTIADDVEVKNAELKDGLLKVSMEKIIPESKKKKQLQSSNIDRKQFIILSIKQTLKSKVGFQ